eukprot:2481361-Prymnesium_polylepis.1
MCVRVGRRGAAAAASAPQPTAMRPPARAARHIARRRACRRVSREGPRRESLGQTGGSPPCFGVRRRRCVGAE